MARTLTQQNRYIKIFLYMQRVERESGIKNIADKGGGNNEYRFTGKAV